MRTTFFYLTSLILLLSLVGCRNTYKEKQQQERQSRAEALRKDSLALKIATVPTLDCLPIFIGVEDSLFVRNGVDVHIKQRNAQIDCDTLVEGKYVEGVVSDLIRTERLQRKGIALSYFSATNAYWKLISNRTARIKEIKQLSDKMIAITRYSATDYLADVAIDSVKPQYDVYRIQINDPSIRLKMILNNEMDAALLTEPQATTAILYKNPVLMDSRDKNIRLGVIAFRDAAIRDHRRREQLKLFTKVYNMICDSINHYGLVHYSPIIKKYMNTDDRTIKALPRLKFEHAAAPRGRDIAIARRRWR